MKKAVWYSITLVVHFCPVKQGPYLLEAGTVGEIEGEQGLRLDEDMCQLGAAIQV